MAPHSAVFGLDDIHPWEDQNTEIEQQIVEQARAEYGLDDFATWE